MIWHEALFILLALVAEILGTLAGFGSSTFFVPLAHYLEDFRTVLALTALLHVFSNGVKLILFGRAANWRVALGFVIPGVVTVIVGAWLSQYLQLQWFETVLGAFLIVYALVFLLKPGLQFPARLGSTLLAGALAGFVTGLLGTGGSIRAAGLTAFQLSKDSFIATSALADMFTDGSRTVVYLWQGYLQPQQYFYVPFLLVAAWLGSWLGQRILLRVSEKLFRLWVRVLILLIGATMVIRGLVS